MQETHVWGCLAVVLAFSCARVHATGFASIVCITLLLLTLVPSDAGPRPPSAPPAETPPAETPPNSTIDLGGGSSEPVSARVGEMVPNPRLVKDRIGKEDDDGAHGQGNRHEKFGHLKRRTNASLEKLWDAFYKDAKSNGFKP